MNVIEVEGRQYKSVLAESNHGDTYRERWASACANCVARNNSALCQSLPRCNNPNIYFVPALDEDEKLRLAMLPNIDPPYEQQAIRADVGQARADDPQTSKEAAEKIGGGKLADLILTVMGQREGNEADIGWTGKELASLTGRPLNSITPRFAQLRRAGLIHSAGRRDKQIVWKTGNGVR